MYKEIEITTRERDLDKKIKVFKRLEDIREIRPARYGNHIVTFDEPNGKEECIVSEEEANEIKKMLLSSNAAESLTKEIKTLTGAVRDLWTLLRARLH